MKFKDVDARDGMIVMGIEDDHGRRAEITFNSIDAASLIGALRTKLEEAIGQPSAISWELPGIVRMQLSESPAEIIFRIYMNDQIFHGYPVPANTNLYEELKLLGQRLEARNMAKSTHQEPGTRN